jgi:arsenate reductase
MSEGLINHLLGDRWEAFSAGTKPSGYVHPLAIEVMGELGIDLSDQTSKSVDQFRGEDFDVVITVCDNAAHNCPTWLGDGEVKHIGFPDPAAATGTEAEKRQSFRDIRDAIRDNVLGFLSRWQQREATSNSLSFVTDAGTHA